VPSREPPYPSDTRAKGWRFEIDHERIRQSDTWALASPELRPWFLMLWMVAWEQTPCGSLPEDDTLIAARIGMSAKAFQRHRPLLMRGWWKADDGRLYHDVLVLRVKHMLAKRAKDAKRTADYRAAVSAVSHDGSDGVTRDEQMADREFDTRDQAPSTSSLPTVESAPKRATRKCPETFALTPEMLDWVERELPMVNAASETEKFRDYTFRTAIKDWTGAWRNWMRKAAEFSANKRPINGTEPAWAREKRERMAQLAPGVAAKPAAEVFDVTARLVG
jgi:hypothetical protein